MHSCNIVFLKCLYYYYYYCYYLLTFLLTYLLTYLLTPWSRVLLEKITGSVVSQEIPRIFGTRKFLTLLTSARHLSLSWANSIQSPQPPPISWRAILILSSHLRLCLPNGLFPSDFPTRNYYYYYYFQKTAIIFPTSMYGMWVRIINFKSPH